MAKNPNPLLLLLLLLLSLFTNLSPTSAVSEPELDAAIAALRSRGYYLIGNAITASDVRLSLLSSSNSDNNASYTLLAPTDAALFSLDMTSTSSAYVTALRFHVALGLFSYPHLLSLPSPSSIPTLVPHRDLSISRNAGQVAVDGVDVVNPELYSGQNLVVHGLDGILPLRRKAFTAPAQPTSKKLPDSKFSPSNSPGTVSSPSIVPDSSHSPRSVFSPSIAPDSRTSPSTSPRSTFSPTIAPVSGHSLSISLSSEVSPLSHLSTIASPDSTDPLSIAPETGFSPSNSPDLSSPVSVGDPVRGRILWSEESESSSGNVLPTMKGTGFSWNNCDLEVAVDCRQFSSMSLRPK